MVPVLYQTISHSFCLWSLINELNRDHYNALETRKVDLMISKVTLQTRGVIVLESRDACKIGLIKRKLE